MGAAGFRDGTPQAPFRASNSTVAGGSGKAMFEALGAMLGAVGIKHLVEKMCMVPLVQTPYFQAAQPWVKNWHVNTWFDEIGEGWLYAWLEGKRS